MAERKRASDDEAAALAAKGAPAQIDVPGDGSGPRALVSPEPGAALEPLREAPAPKVGEPAGGQRFVLKDGALVVEAGPAAVSNIADPVPGGRYLVGGVLVDADGKPVGE